MYGDPAETPPQLKESTMGEYRYRLFGGDAAHQRADDFAERKAKAERADWFVRELGTTDAPFDRFGLDCWGRAGNGTIYSYVAFRPRGGKD
jgi:hypothetical protein